MKNMIKFFSLVLCIVILSTSIPVYASTEGFISFIVETIDNNGNVNQTKEVGFTDGETVFVSTSFLEKYTLYNFSAESEAFTRKGQPEDSFFGRVELLLPDKKVKVYPISTTFMEYALNDYYVFGEQFYLPLDQMCAYLKATVKVEGTTISLLNSGYSLADAEYALSLIKGSTGYLTFNTPDVIEDVFMGNKTLYMVSAVKNYLSSTVFGLRLDNLLIRGNIGKIDDYKNFIERCITNNDNFIEAITNEDEFVNRVHTAHKINQKINSSSKTFKDYTSVVKNLSKSLQNGSVEDALLYVNARDWNALFDTICTVTKFADYYLKLGSMCEDNENMLLNFEDYYLRTSGVEYLNQSIVDMVNSDIPAFYYAINLVKDKYTGNIVKNISSQVGEIFAEKFSQGITKAALEEIIPSTAVISIVASVFKVLGYDLRANTEYSNLIDIYTKSEIYKFWSDIEESVYMKTKDDTEEYRLSAIFLLLSLEQCYISSNKLNKSVGGSDNLYNGRIEKIKPIINLYYVAAQSKDFDSFEGIDNILERNNFAISNSSLMVDAERVSQEEAEKSENVSGKNFTIDKRNQYNSQYCTGHFFDANYVYYTEEVNVVDAETPFAYSIDNLIRKDLNSGEETILLKNRNITTFVIYDGYIYFFEYDKAAINRCKIGTSEVEQIAYPYYEARLTVLDDKLLVSGLQQDFASEIVIYTLDGGEKIKTGIYAVTIFTTNDKVYAVGSTRQYDENVSLFEIDANTGKKKEVCAINRNCSGHLIGVDEKYAYVVEEDDKYVLWCYDLKTGEESKAFESKDYISGICILDDGLLYIRNDNLYIWQNGVSEKLVDRVSVFSFIGDKILIKKAYQGSWEDGCKLS